MRNEELPPTQVLVEQWRASITRPLLIGLGVTGAGLLAVFASVITPWSLGLGVGVVAAVLGLGLWTNVADWLRSAALLVAFLFATSMALLSTADAGAGAIYGLTGTIFGLVLVGPRAGASVLVLATALFALTTWSTATGVVLIPPNAELGPTERMAGVTFVFLTFGGLVLASVQFLMRRLTRSLMEREVAVEGLAREAKERAEALEQLRDAHAELQTTQSRLVDAEKMEVLGRLAGGIAHDMNNLLTVILSESELVRLRDEEAADNLVSAVEEASQLTRQLLAIGRRDVAKPEPLSLAEQVESVAAILKRSVRGDVVVNIERLDEVGVMADRGQLRQVLLNLGTNAAHAMPQGGRLTFRLVAKGGRAHLEVRDTGVGMDDATRDRIFEPFFTTKELRKGSGLGLASARAIVEGLEGSIRCESRVGEGTRFHIELPALEQAVPRSGRSAPRETPNLRLDGRRILVVEDEVRLRAVVCSALEAAGAEVLDAGDPQLAIAVAEAAGCDFDLLWTDVVMPHGGARRIISWFREQQPEAKVLICTGHADDDALRDELASGRYPLLSKPFSTADALRAVSLALRKPV